MRQIQVEVLPDAAEGLLHDLRFAGETAEAKLERIRAEISKLKADALVVSDPHAVSWLLNIRGSDVPHTPIVLAFALVPREGRPALYVDGRKLGNDVRHCLEEIADVRASAEFERDLAAFGSSARPFYGTAKVLGPYAFESGLFVQPDALRGDPPLNFIFNLRTGGQILERNIDLAGRHSFLPFDAL